MKQKAKQIIILIVVILLGLTMLSPLFAMTDSEYNKFADDEEHYQNLCKNYTSENRTECESFSDFKNEKIKRAKGDIKEAESSINKIKDEIDDEEKNLESYHNEIEALEVDIIANEQLVAQTERAISEVEEQIEEREERIEELDELIKEFLVNMQGEMRVNGFIEFIMGASDFSDIVRRSEGMKRIKEYNEALINEVLEEQELLEEDKNNLISKKAQLENEKELLVVQVQKSKALLKVIDKIVYELRRQKKTQENLIEQSTQISESELKNLESIVAQPPPPPPPPPPTPTPSDPAGGNDDGGGSNSGGGSHSGGQASSGWTYPVIGNFRIGEGVWNYGSGGKHLGQDFPATMGTTLVAPANGAIINTQGGCGDNHNINDGCNGGWGNWLTMMVNVDGSYYGLLYAHIQQGGFLSSDGQPVSPGQAVAKMGSSGRSSGPHLHVEVYYLGQDTETAISYSNTTNTFGTGGSSSERANSRCHINGKSAPCRMNPRAVFP